MNSRKQLLIAALPLLLVVGILILFWRGLYLKPHELPSALLNKAVPKFDMQTMAGKKVTQTLFQNHVSLVNVWASWCVTCRAEHAELLNMANSVTIAKDKQVQLIGLNYKDTREMARDWLGTVGDPYKAVIFDPKGILGMKLGVYGVPETFLIDKKGVIRYRHVGEITSDNWKTILLPLINQLKRS